MRSCVVALAITCVTAALPAAPAPRPRLPEGVKEVALPDETVTFTVVRDGKGWVVQAKTKTKTVRAPTMFLRHREHYVEFRADAGTMRIATPETWWSLDGTLEWGRGTFLVPPTKVRWADRARPGDVVLTSPRVRIEAARPQPGEDPSITIRNP